MKKIVCDICGRPADYMCKVSVSQRLLLFARHCRTDYDGRPWSLWRETHLCDRCLDRMREAARNETR